MNNDISHKFTYKFIPITTIYNQLPNRSFSRLYHLKSQPQKFSYKQTYQHHLQLKTRPLIQTPIACFSTRQFRPTQQIGYYSLLTIGIAVSSKELKLLFASMFNFFLSKGPQHYISATTSITVKITT